MIGGYYDNLQVENLWIAKGRALSKGIRSQTTCVNIKKKPPLFSTSGEEQKYRDKLWRETGNSRWIT